MSSRLQQPAADSADALAGLREVLRITRPDADTGRISQAYDVAAFWHQGQTRKSGDPYITHPLAVATILAENGADDSMLCAAILHDTIEDTPYTLVALNCDFGNEVAALVTGTAALDQIKSNEQRTVAQVMATVTSADSRVLAIKVADRLHNMRTLQYISKAKQLRKARESLGIFAPVAARLSMGTIEAELEALAKAAIKRHQQARSASGRLLFLAAALLPRATRIRWCEEWLGELHTLTGRRERAGFAIHTALGIPQMASLSACPPGATGGQANDTSANTDRTPSRHAIGRQSAASYPDVLRRQEDMVYMLIFLIGLIFLLLGVLFGGAVCVHYIRREIVGDVGPKLKRMQLQLDNIEAEINLAIAMRHAELSSWSPGNPAANRRYQNNA